MKNNFYRVVTLCYKSSSIVKELWRILIENYYKKKHSKAIAKRLKVNFLVYNWPYFYEWISLYDEYLISISSERSWRVSVTSQRYCWAARSCCCRVLSCLSGNTRTRRSRRGTLDSRLLSWRTWTKNKHYKHCLGFRFFFYNYSDVCFCECAVLSNFLWVERYFNLKYSCLIPNLLHHLFFTNFSDGRLFLVYVLWWTRWF